MSGRKQESNKRLESNFLFFFPLDTCLCCLKGLNFVFREERPEDPKSKSTTSTMTGENTGGKYSVCAQYVHLTQKKRIGTIENV